MLESYFQKILTNYLKSKGHFTYVETKGNGLPDVFVCYKGKFIAIELKVDHTLQPKQALCIKNLNKKGLYAFAFKHSDDWKSKLLDALEGNVNDSVIDHNAILDKIKW